METGNVLHHQALLPSDYSISTDAECIDQYSSQTGHSSYTHSAHDTPVDYSRRDGTLSQPAASPFPYSATHGTRLFSETGAASDATASFPNGNIFTDASSGSISSPVSAGSAVAPNSYYGSETTPRYTSYTNLSGAVTQPQAFTPGTYAGSRFSTMYEMPLGATLLRRHSLAITANTVDARYENGSSNPLHGLRSTLSDPANAIQRTSYAANPQYLPRPVQNSVYTSYAQTPRIVNPATIPSFSPGPALYMADGNGPQSNMSREATQSHDFKFPLLECAAEIKCNEQALTPEIHAKVEKGFFLSEADRKWTCYRRNYFSVAASFELHCNTNNGLLYVKNRNKDEQVQAMGMRLSAAIDGNGGKTIELIQHTPKRDNGPKSKIEITKVAPLPSSGRTDTLSPNHVYQVPMGTFHQTGMATGPYLPLQNIPERNSDPEDRQPTCHSSMGGMQYSGNPQMSSPASASTYTFERIQFKQATANNGKRRATQQYFHLIVELFADVRKDAADEPKWIKVAHRTSEKIVVRGRSPSHYQNEGHGPANRGGSANGGSYGGSVGGSIGYGGLNGGGYTNGYRGSLGSNAGPGASNYTYHAGGDGRGSSSSGADDSDMDDPLDHHGTTAHVVPEAKADRTALSSSTAAPPGYRYHPAPLYDDFRPQLPKIETHGQFGSEPRQYAFKAELPDAVPGSQWQANPLADRFQGFPSSHGWYPQASVSASGCR